MVRLVDSHAHLNARDYDHDREAVVEAALETLACVIDVGTDFETAQTSLALSRAFDRVYSTVGVSPHRARAHDES
ncbi:MAG: TatD family hydrolase, partial [Candidatus Riflebacteria bacterium]|nr:TatD family hydrolase [Candidatus Riflebacteria bacterium]